MRYKQRKYLLGALVSFCCVYFGMHWYYFNDHSVKLNAQQIKRIQDVSKQHVYKDKKHEQHHDSKVISKTTESIKEFNFSHKIPGEATPPEVTTRMTTQIPDNTAVNRVSDYYVDDFYEKLKFKLGDKGLYEVEDPGFESETNVTSYGRDKPLTIIVVPHSHNDPGWLWTLQTYYEVRTKHILTSTVKFLTANPDFRMIWSETIFLKMWWDDATVDLREGFKELVNAGKVEILSGGWVSVDEATTHYTAVLDQLIEGHQWLKDTLGVHVNTSWSIDPFGYSMTLPYLWKKAGMKNMAILRIHGAIKKRMGNRKLMTYNWRQQWDSTGEHDIQCHVEPYTLYNIEHSCGPYMPVCAMLDAARNTMLPENSVFTLPDKKTVENLDDYMDKLVKNYMSKASNYKQNVLLMPHGDDFRYIYEHEWESQRNKMVTVMNYINTNPKWNITMRFGTVGEYFDLLEKEQTKTNVLDSTITGDFFTYTDRDNEYWSGYYTTRPFDKRNIRWLLEMIKTAEMLTSYSLVKARQLGMKVDEQNILWNLQEARRAHGLVQHHDAITGTSTASTQVDFRKRINVAIAQVQNVTSSLLPLILGDNTTKPVYEPLQVQPQELQPQSDVIFNVRADEQEIVFINIYTQPRKEIVSIVTNSTLIEIYNYEGNLVRCQIVPEWTNSKTISSQMFRVYFEAELPAVSLAKYKVKKIQRKESPSVEFSTVLVYNGEISQDAGKSTFYTGHMGTLQSEMFKITTNNMEAYFSSKFGFIRKICRGQDFQLCINVEVDFRLYQTENSNAYCFGTIVHRPFPLIEQGAPLIKVISGPLVSQVIVSHRMLQHVVTLYNTSEVQGNSVHITNFADFRGNDKKNKEFIMVLKSDLLTSNNNYEYYTDSNGFQMVKREFRDILPFGANFYPMTSMAFIDGAAHRLTLHSAQSHGIGNVGEKELLVVIDRMPIDTGKGLEEPVEDNRPTRSDFVLTIEDKRRSRGNTENKYGFKIPSLFSHHVNEYLQLPIQKYATYSDTVSGHKICSLLNSALLPDVFLANVKTLMNDRHQLTGTGLTFHKKHFSSKFEGYLSQDVSQLNLETLFPDLKIGHAYHTYLTHVRYKDDVSSNKIIQIKTGELESVLIEW